MPPPPPPPPAAASRPRVLSGIQPTGSGSHLGNYLGAIRHWVAMQDGYDAFYFIPDLHAMTVPHDPAALRRRTRETVAELVAAGLDPARCTLFVQSQLHEHAELAWVLGCLTGYGEASRMTQFKDKSARGDLGSASVGLFVYPVLQAADILMYNADQVPVGEDQRQHLELTRDLAQRFNARFGPTFTIPEAYAKRTADRVMDLQDPTRKMSKSLPPAGTIYLQDDPGAMAKKVRRAVTDTGTEVRAGQDKPGLTNLLAVYSGLTGRSVSDLEEAYAGRGYGDLKKELAEVVVDVVQPIGERTRELLAHPDHLDAIMAAGSDRAGEIAARTMTVVRERVGLVPLTLRRRQFGAAEGDLSTGKG